MELRNSILTIKQINNDLGSFKNKESNTDAIHVVDNISFDAKELSALYNDVKENFEQIKNKSPLAISLKHFQKITNSKDDAKISEGGLKFYGMKDISKSDRLKEIYDKFPYFDIIIRRLNTKINQRRIRLIYNCPSVDESKYQEINELVEDDLNTLLYKNQFQNIGHFLSKVFYETLLYGVSYVYFDKHKIITTLDQKDLRVLYNYDGITYNPTTFLQRVFLTKEYWDTVRSFQSMYTSLAAESAFVSIEENPNGSLFNLLNLTNYNSFFKNLNSKFIFKTLKSEHIFPCYFYPKDSDLYIESPMQSFEKDITEFVILEKILKETQNPFYGNMWFILLRDLSTSLKNIGTIPKETLKIIQNHRGIAQKNLVEGLKSTKQSIHQTCASEIVDKIETFEKNTDVREILFKELNRVVDRIIGTIGETGFKSENTTNKRNENIQMIESEDFYTGIIYTYDNFVTNIYKHLLRERLIEYNVPEEEISYAYKTLKLFYDENAVLTLEDQMKLIQTLTAAGRHITTREIRSRIGFNSNTELEDQNNRRMEAEIAASSIKKEEPNNGASNLVANVAVPKNQYGSKNPSSSTVNK